MAFVLLPVKILLSWRDFRRSRINIAHLHQHDRNVSPPVQSKIQNPKSKIKFRLCSAVFILCSIAGAVLGQDPELRTDFIRLVVAPDQGAPVKTLELVATGNNEAGGGGLVLEGFGVGSYYVPNRRLNEKLETRQAAPPALIYSYDCDGPNIAGLHVTRTMEAMPGEPSLRVQWRIENKGAEEQWVAPWVRNEVVPGGAKAEAGQVRMDVPTLDGILDAKWTGYRPAARNWLAATHPAAQETVYGVFNADQTHSFLVVFGEEEKTLGFQTAFVPRLMKPGDAWETTYRLNVVRGLTHVDFATDELAVQVDYTTGQLQLLIACARALPPVEIRASVKAANGQVWRLPKKRFQGKPNMVVRCTYDWGAPEDGAYELLAELREGDKPCDLGKDTAPPHGGIDTQFVVGKPKRVAFEPWTQAPLALQRGSRTLKRSMAAPGDTAIWFEDSMQKVFREDVPEPAGPVEPSVPIALARNESESFQVVIRPPNDAAMKNVNVSMRDLACEETGCTIPASNVKMAQVAYCPVRVPTYFEGPSGDWPDPLPPLAPFTAQGGRCNPIWFTLYAPPDTPPGLYKGLIELSSSNHDPVELWLEATVYDFDLPRTPALKTDFGFRPKDALGWCKAFGYKGSQADLNAAYLDNALAHRVTLRELTQFPDADADYAARLAAFEPTLNDLIARGASTFSVPASLLETPNQLRQAAAFVAKHGLDGRAFCPIAEGPPPAEWPDLLKRIQQWNKATTPSPRPRGERGGLLIPAMVTTFGLEPFLNDAAGIWDVHSPMLDTANNRPILERVRDAREVWWYVDYAPPRPYGNLFTDFAGIEHRILFWQTWVLGIRGFHYSSVNRCGSSLASVPQDPWQGALDDTPVNGDGLLIYPGPQGPVSSIRWEIVRDGIDDYDYLVLLKERLRKLQEAGGHEPLIETAARALDLKGLVPDLVTFPRDPGILQAKRAQIARAIVELGKPLR